MTAPVLELAGAVRRYGDVVACAGVDLRLLPGEVHAVVGLNGAGKSTIMQMMLGMTRPTAGRALLRGRDVAAAAPGDWAGVGHLVGAPLAYPELTVARNLRVAALLSGVGRAGADAAARAVADELALTPYWGRRARALSLGNRQRLGLGAALVADPAVLVLDEPTNGLDPAGVVLVREALLRRVRGRGAAVLVSSHHLDEVARIADRITVVNAGRVIGALDPGGVDIERAFFALVYADVEKLGGAP